jgi:hypothetical protein
MVAKKTQSVEPATIRAWHEALEGLHARIELTTSPARRSESGLIAIWLVCWGG